SVPAKVPLAVGRTRVVRRTVQLEVGTGLLVVRVEPDRTAPKRDRHLPAKLFEPRTGEHVVVIPEFQWTPAAGVEPVEESQEGSPLREPISCPDRVAYSSRRRKPLPDRAQQRRSLRIGDKHRPRVN